MKLVEAAVLSQIIGSPVYAVLCEVCDKQEVVLNMCQGCFSPFPKDLVRKRNFINSMNHINWINLDPIG